MSNDKGGRDGGEINEDVDILRKEYRNMQANRNAFAHESDLVSHVREFGIATIVASRNLLLSQVCISTHCRTPDCISRLGATEATGNP
jgi:hypothetical protein